MTTPVSVLGGETATETPVVTEAPATTQAPAATETPAVTEAPGATEAPPEATEKPPATEKPAGPPEKYEFKLPEGMELNEALLTEAEPIFREIGLPQEQAQKLVQFYAETEARKVKEAYDTWLGTRAEWVAQAKADKEIGGAEFDANAGLAKTAIEKIGGERAAALKEALNFTGAGDHPEVIRAFATIGKLMVEHKFTFGGSSNKPGPVDPAKLMYPDLP